MSGHDSDAGARQAGTEPGAAAVPARVDADARHLLHGGVPLSLILDLGAPRGPDSAAICDAEGAPAEEWWRQP